MPNLIHPGWSTLCKKYFSPIYFLNMTKNSPELIRQPLMVAKFIKSEVGLGMAKEMFLSKEVKHRDFCEDMRLLFEEQPIEVEGLENIPKDGGGLIIVNHPDISIIAPAIFTLPVAIKDTISRDDMSILVGIRIKVLGDHDLPGAPTVINKFFDFYPDHLLQVPGNKRNHNYSAGRKVIKNETVARLAKGQLVALSPEALISFDGSILPTNIYRLGAGELGMTASILEVPIIPTGIWLEDNKIKVRVGEGFNLPTNEDPQQAVIHMMGEVAKLIPQKLRGPYKDK